MKRILLTAISFIFLFSACNEPDAPKNTPPATNTTPPLSVVKHTISKKTTAYNVSVEYPQVENMTSTVVEEEINSYLNLTDGVDEFIMEADEVAKEYDLIAPYEKTSTFEVVLQTDQILSIELSLYEYTGGAHGLGMIEGTNFNLETGKIFGISDLFEADANFLEVLSTYCISQLKEDSILTEMSDEGWILQGAGPNIDNYSIYTIQKDGLHFYFAPYQVAPYAAGDFEIVVPYAELNDVIPMKGILRTIL